MMQTVVFSIFYMFKIQIDELACILLGYKDKIL